MSHSQQYHFLGYKLDVVKRCLFGPEGNSIPLSSRAMDTLQLLVEHRGQTLSKLFLVERVWPDVYVEENNLNQAIASIRKALSDSKNEGRFIKTVTGRGYCFIAELDDVEQVENVDLLSTQSGQPSISLVSLPQLHKESPGSNEGPVHKNIYRLALICAIGIFSAVLFTVFSGPELPQLITTTPENPDVIPDSIAVLTLSSLTLAEDVDNDIFALGLHDELINQLSQVESLKIVARESVLSPAVQQLSIPEVGRLLRVESVITGTILFVDSQARVNLQMIDPTTGVIKWAHAYEVDTSNYDEMIFAQKNVVLAVANIFHSKVNVEELPLVFSKETESFEAYRYNIAARQAYYREDYSKAWMLSKKAIALDPDYLGALYNYSKANSFLAAVPLKEVTSSEYLRLALESSQRIIELAPEKHEGYVLEIVALGSNGQWHEAMRGVQHLEDMGAPLWDVQLIAPVLMSMGDFQGAIEILEENLKVEPVNSYGRGLLMSAYESTGNTLQARLEYELGEKLNPNWWGEVVNLLLSLGRNEKVQDIQGLYRTPDQVKEMLISLEQNGSETIYESLISYQKQEKLTSAEVIFYAAMAVLIDEHKLAIEFMHRATQELTINFYWFWLPLFQEARQLPEFKLLLEDIGLVAYWREQGWPEICRPMDDSFICD